MCEKGQGTCLCAGCKKYFCMKDFKSHRNTLFNEMDVIVGNYNDLQERINRASQQKDSRSPIFAQIDQWQNNAIGKVKEAAELARQQAKKILNSKRVEITTQFETLSQDLIRLKETGDFVEHDLVRLYQKIQKVNQDLQLMARPPAIELHTEQSDKIVWNQLIYVEEKSTYSDNILGSANGSWLWKEPPEMELLRYFENLNRIETETSKTKPNLIRRKFSKS